MPLPPRLRSLIQFRSSRRRQSSEPSSIQRLRQRPKSDGWRHEPLSTHLEHVSQSAMTNFKIPANWHVRDYPTEKVRDLAETLHCSLPFARLLLSRGLGNGEAARQFLYPGPEDIHSCVLLKDVGRAVGLISKTIADGWPILVYGDFDTDGIMATMIMRTALEVLGARVRTYIPDRVSEGHGMLSDVVQKFAADGVRTIVTVDQGQEATMPLLAQSNWG